MSFKSPIGSFKKVGERDCELSHMPFSDSPSSCWAGGSRWVSSLPQGLRRCIPAARILVGSVSRRIAHSICYHEKWSPPGKICTLHMLGPVQRSRWITAGERLGRGCVLTLYFLRDIWASFPGPVQRRKWTTNLIQPGRWEPCRSFLLSASEFYCWGCCKTIRKKCFDVSPLRALYTIETPSWLSAPGLPHPPPFHPRAARPCWMPSCSYEPHLLKKWSQKNEPVKTETAVTILHSMVLISLSFVYAPLFFLPPSLSFSLSLSGSLFHIQHLQCPGLKWSKTYFPFHKPLEFRKKVGVHFESPAPKPVDPRGGWNQGNELRILPPKTGAKFFFQQK